MTKNTDVNADMTTKMIIIRSGGAGGRRPARRQAPRRRAEGVAQARQELLPDRIDYVASYDAVG